MVANTQAKRKQTVSKTGSKHTSKWLSTCFTFATTFA